MCRNVFIPFWVSSSDFRGLLCANAKRYRFCSLVSLFSPHLDSAAPRPWRRHQCQAERSLPAPLRDNRGLCAGGEGLRASAQAALSVTCAGTANSPALQAWRAAAAGGDPARNSHACRRKAMPKEANQHCPLG